MPNIKQKQNGATRGAVTAFVVLLIVTAVLGLYDFIIPDTLSRYAGEQLPCVPTVQLSEREVTGTSGSLTQTSATASLFGVLPLKDVQVNTFGDIRLCPGGIPFGVRLSTAGVLIVGTETVKTTSGEVNPAEASGLHVRDIITHVNGQEVNTAEELTALIEGCDGTALDIRYTRGGVGQNASLTPARCADDEKYKTGVWVRDSTAGIGTVTFIVPETGAFGGLGHGICDADTGELMPLLHGTVVDVTISGINRGAPGTPGEIKGFLGTGKSGNLTDNTDCGVFGIYLKAPGALTDEPLPIALSDQVREGEASIICTLEDGKRESYSVRVAGLNHSVSGAGSKNFVVEVTDPALLEKTGGIVQGMSGSPIIQDGRLIGAVTHVLISDPTKGYGILIENMLAKMPELLQ